MSFFGAKSILGHESTFEPVNEYICRNIVQAIKSNDLKQFNLMRTTHIHILIQLAIWFVINGVVKK